MIRQQMTNEGFDPDSFQAGQQRELDRSLLVKFFYKPRQDMAETEKAGRPVFKDVVYIDIRVPGDRDGGVCRPATPHDIQRFQQHYDAFMARVDEPEKGTPLSEWPQISRSQVEELAFFNCKTVEHLANMADVHAQQHRGILTLKQRAQEWLAKNNETERLAESLTEQEQVIAEQGAQIKALQERIEELTRTPSAPRPKAKARGRPKKKAAVKETADGGTADTDSQ